MAETRTCGKCGLALSAYAPPGLCANCMLQQGFDPLVAPTSLAKEGVSLSVDDLMASLPPSTAVRYFGDYELLEEIARGGMGIVYRARQLSLGRLVAVKMMLSGPLSSPELVKRFRAEAAAAASLQHPNIVAIHEVGVHQGHQYFAMDFVQGQSLAKLLANGPLPARRAAAYLKTIAEAIHYAHERGLLHRDLKPSNVLIDGADQPRVTDFGLAKRWEGDSELTLSGQVLGSPNYMPPEQAEARRGQLSRRSDVYALGAMLYHVLTGRPPFVGETITDTLGQVIHSEPVSLRLLNPSIPRDLETICLKCLEKEPIKRYPTAQAFTDELNRFLRDEPIEACPVNRLEKAWRWSRRNPVLALLGVSLVLVFAFGFISTLWQWRLAEANRASLDQSLYDSDMSLAQHAWDEGDLGYARDLLERHQRRAGEPDRRGFEWYYFRNLCQGEQRMTLSGHRNAVKAVAFSPDGKLLATASLGDAVQLWDSATGRRLKTLPEQNVISLAFSPDGQALGMGGRDQLVVRNLQTEEVLLICEKAFGRFCIAFLPRGTLLVLGKDGVFPQADGGSAELWNYRTRELKHVFPESGGHIALSPLGDRLATGDWEGTTKIWDLPSEQLVRSVKTGGAVAMALSPDSQTLATSDYWGGTTRLWSVTTGDLTGWLTNYQHRVWSLAFSPDGRSLATGGADHTLRLWNVATRQQTERFEGHGGEVTSIAFSPDGQTLASGSYDKTGMLWNVNPSRTETTISNVISRPIFSPDSLLVAAGIGQNRVAIWDVATLQMKAELTGAHDVVGFSPDGTGLITRGTNYFLRTFDVATRAVRETIPGRAVEGPYSQAALSPEGQILATGSADGTLTFSDAKSGAVLVTIPDNQSLFSLAFSPGGKLLATAGTAPKDEKEIVPVKIWDVAAHKWIAAPAGLIGGVLSVAFSPDGKTLVTCATDDLVKFWDTTTWKENLPPIGQKEYASSLAYSPDGRTLATACSDGTMKLWDVATRHELASLKLGMYGFFVAFSPNGQTLAVWNPFEGAGLLRLWRAPVADMKLALPGAY